MFNRQRTALALLLVALATNAPALPLAAWPVFALALTSRLLPQRLSALRLLGLAGVVLAAGFVWGWVDEHTLRLVLLCVLALKWAEAKSGQEFALVTGGALIAGTLGLLQWGEWTGLILIALFSLLALAALEAANATAITVTNMGIQKPVRQLLASLRRHGVRVLLALPLAAALFVFFPRIPGPLWDIGLSFGLPLSIWFEPDSQGLGVSTRLKPGQSQTGARVTESRPVLVAEFVNWVPPTSLLYWRGPVYYDFDGQEWRLDPVYEAGQGRALMRQGWTKSAQFSETLARKSNEISYSVRLSPHNRLWLYGLDLPAALAAESFVSTDWQVLAHRPVEAETSYTLKSWLEWEAGGTLDESLQARALALPEHGNPRLRELGAELAAQPQNERVIAALTRLAKGDYRVRDQFELVEGADSFDHLWFETRTGNADLYAGALVFLMRAAGVPARLVTGYRGGKLMALTDYVIVKQNHAHAWVETWDSEKGWRRIDAIDLIDPERFKGEGDKKTAPAKQPERQKNTAQPPQKETKQAPQTAHSQPSTATASSPPEMAKAPAFSIGVDLDAFFSRWLFKLDGEAQRALLSSLGEQLGEKLGKSLGGGFAWVWLLLGAALSCVLVMLLRTLIEWRRDAQRLPAPQRTWNRLVRLLGKRGFSREPWESPIAFAHRVGSLHPRWDKPLQTLADAWSDWLYARKAPDAPQRITAAARSLHNLILAEAAPARSRPGSRTSPSSSPS